MTDKRQPTQEESAEAATRVAALLRESDGPERLFGVRLRALRERWGYSQEELARVMQRAGFKWQQTTAAKTEAGNRPVRLNEAYALAAHFGVTVDDILSEEFITGDLEDSLTTWRLSRSILAATQMRFEALQAHRNAVDSELKEIGELMTDLLGAFEDTNKDVTGRLRHLLDEADAEIRKLGGEE
ncbi:helix-turn-helix transcriptional regulator [Streptomyces sp. DT203]|uniref:helix-turn-helix transcriptional regulator n=1 Tax=Streptomyces sp. DT203 TaxID=3393424 RepID=UPI003CF850F7